MCVFSLSLTVKVDVNGLQRVPRKEGKDAEVMLSCRARKQLAWRGEGRMGPWDWLYKPSKIVYLV